MAESIEGRVAELLDDKNFAQVGTTRKDGSPHVTPVWVDHDGEAVLLNTSEGRAWPANARRTGKVALNVLNQENPYEYVYIQGTVAEATHEGADEHIDKLAKKYMGVDEYPFRQEGERRLIVRITPDKITHNNPG
jgi:PPOX class probable F420-dependent enzyme